MSAVDVSVVVSHYEQPGSLALVLAALSVQTLPAHRFEVVVADDGSAVPPVPGPQPYRVQVVGHDDRGFRLAAVRNLGVAATTGDLVCFLDGDTVPGPDYLAQVLAEAERTPDVVVAGRRRHAELSGWDPEDLLAWFAGRRPGPVELEEPGWLRDGYRWTADLREADDESYRYVIGAVTSVHRSVLERAGGYDERFVGYGGEDWEAVNRWWLAGAELRHVPAAVAWHDGPDVTGRQADLDRVQNEQALALARLLPSEATRPPGLVWELPQVVVEVDDRGWTVEQVLLCVASLLAGTDAGVWLREGTAARSGGPLAQDSRVHEGTVPAEVGRRCRVVVHVDRPLELRRPLREVVARLPVDAPGLSARHARRRPAADGRTVPGPPRVPGGGDERLVEPLDEVRLSGVLRSRAEARAR